MKRKGVFLALLTVWLLVLSGCGNKVVVDKATEKKPSTGDSWTVMIYMSASSLEEEHNRASELLKNISYDLPDNINVIIEAGGAKEWDIEGLNADKTQDFAVQKNGIRLIHEEKSLDMGDAKTYSRFLKRTVKNYPANKYISIIWGEGAGPVYGMAHDITHGYSSLTPDEIRDAYKELNVKLDIIGFDASLSANLETASALVPYADYLVASEDVMPMSGWDYRGLFEFLSENPDASSAQVGQAICDGVKKNASDESKRFLAMSVIDLTDIENLTSEFDSLAKSMSEACDDIDKLRAMDAYLGLAHYMGANAQWEGYSNIIDIKSFADAVGNGIKLDTENIEHSISKSVIYKATGKLQKTASGLGVYYPKTHESKEINKYRRVCPSLGYMEFIDKTTPNPTIENRTANCTDTASRQYYETVKASNTIEAEPDLNGKYLLRVTNPDIISEPSVNLYKFDDETGVYFYLYNDNNVFYSNIANIYEYELHNNQLELNKIPVSSYLVNDFGAKKIYSIPVLYKEKLSSVRVLREDDESDIKYTVLGIWSGADRITGIASRSYGTVSVGDTITPVYRTYGKGANEYSLGKEMTIVFGGLNVKNKSLDDGEYLLSYTVKDVYGEIEESNTANVTAIKGKMQISK